MPDLPIAPPDATALAAEIKDLISLARQRVASVINTELIKHPEAAIAEELTALRNPSNSAPN